MSSKVLIVATLCAIGFGGWRVLSTFQSTPNEISVGVEPEEITFICTETGAISHGEWMPTPALNPATGKRTLMQALYCAKCKKWFRAPPPEVAEQSPGGPVCPVSGDRLTVEEPEETDPAS